MFDNHHHDSIFSLISGNNTHCKLLSWTNNKGLSTVWKTSLNVHFKSLSVGQKWFRHLGRCVLCDRRRMGYINQSLCLCGVIRLAVFIPVGRVFTKHTNTLSTKLSQGPAFGAMLHSIYLNEVKSVNKCPFWPFQLTFHWLNQMPKCE